MTSGNLRLRLAQSVGSLFPLFCAHIPAARFLSWDYCQENPKEVVRRSITGSEIKVSLNDEPGFFYSILGYYDWKILAIANAICKKGDSIVEVGANVGTETVGFSDIVGNTGRVIAFEPAPDNFAKLKENIRIGSLSNVTLESTAVSDKTGLLKFVFPEGSNSGIGHLDFGDGERPGREFDVESTTLDDYLGNESARLLMMDVEGAEPMVLKGGQAWVARILPVIIVEAHKNKADMYDFFSKNGYSVHSIERLGLRPIKLDPEAKQYNWLALHDGQVELVKKVDRAIKLAGLLPPIRGLHPLASL